MLLPLRPEVEAAFAASLELPDAEQFAFLRREYPDNPALWTEVDALLHEYRIAGSFLEPGNRVSRIQEWVHPLLPKALGHYRIHRLLGEGSMGAVYEAEQEQPRRKVALKVIKPGLAGPELLRRFELESEALGRLHHPGIAQIYEAGTADNGFGPQPYFAMEFIRGEPLAAYAESHQLDPRRCLEIMVKICESVHHAHQRGIIHRDLKPGNIIVEESGQPKILDFGVARVTDSDAYATRQTDAGRLVGTLAYMSPEQVLAEPAELDIRSDVYALGVILFELLARRLPYQLAPQLHEAARIIREEEPEQLGSIDRAYRGDIETIAARALEKDKVRRYSSAADLGADIQRYLNDEPIVARRPTAAYHLRKFARRNRVLVSGIAAVFVVLIAGIISGTWEAARARRAEQTAVSERDRAAAARQAATQERDRALNAERIAVSETERAALAEAQAIRERNRAISEKNRADTESATAKAINEFLQNDLLAQAGASAQARPDTKPDPDLKVRTALDRAAARIAGKFETRPAVEAALRKTIGTAYQDLGLYAEAQAQYERALELRRRVFGEDHTETAGIMNDLADLYRTQGKYPLAEPLLSKALEVQRRVLGAEHPDTLVVMSNLAYVFWEEGRYSLAEPLYLKALEAQRRVLGDEHPSTLDTTSSLAVLYRNEGKRAQAEPLFIQVMEANTRVLGPEHPETLTSVNNLAVVYWDQGKYQEAEPLYTKVLEARRRVLGEEHPATLNSMNNLAALYGAERRYSEAEPLYTKVLEARRRVLGQEHPATLNSMNNLATLYRTEQRYSEAEALATKVLEVRRRVLGGEHRETLFSLSNLARLYYEQRMYEQAEPLFIHALDVMRRVLGEEHPDTLSSMNSLARLYQDQGEYEKAEPLFSKALEARRRVLGPQHPDTLETAARLRQLYLDQGKQEQAERLLPEAGHKVQ